MVRAHSLHKAERYISQSGELARRRNLISHLQAEKLLLEEDTYRAIAQRNYMEGTMKKQRIADAITSAVDRAETLRVPPPPPPPSLRASVPLQDKKTDDSQVVPKSSLDKGSVEAARPPPPPPSLSTSVLRIADTEVSKRRTTPWRRLYL